MDSLTTAVPTAANRAQRRAIQREQKKAAKKAAKKAIKLGLPVPASTEIPVHPAPITITTSNNTITPTTTILKEKEDNNNDKDAAHRHQGSPSLASSKRSSLELDHFEYLSVIIPATDSNVSTMHDDTIIEPTIDSASVIMDLPHIISTMSTHEEVNDQEETTSLETDYCRTETLAPLLCPVYVTQPSLLPEHRQTDKNENNSKNDDDTSNTKQIEEEIISDTTSDTVKPSSFLSSPSYSLDDIKNTRIEHHAISPDNNSHHHNHFSKNPDHINFLEKHSSAETLVLKTKSKKFHKVILKSLKKKKATKKEKDPKANDNKKSPPISIKKSWKFWKKDNDKMAMV